MDKINPTSIAVVGVGFMGSLHATAVSQSPVANLAAVVDRDEEMGRQVAAEHRTAYHPSVEEALADESIEAFVLAVPDRAHVEPACTLLEAGKPVLIEKPLADTLKGALRIVQAAHRGGSRILVGHLLRFDPRYHRAAAAVSQGEIGDLLHIRAGRFATRDIGVRMAGTSSVCFYLGIHDVDAVQWISGRPIVEVSSMAVSKLMPSLGVDSEDAIVTTFRLANGAVGQLFNGWTRRDDDQVKIDGRLEAVGTKGSLEIDVRDHGLKLAGASGYEKPDGLHWPTVNGLIGGDLAAEVTHFATGVRSGEPFVMPLEDAVRAVAVNDAILRSVESGQTEEVDPQGSETYEAGV